MNLEPEFLEKYFSEGNSSIPGGATIMIVGTPDGRLFYDPTMRIEMETASDCFAWGAVISGREVVFDLPWAVFWFKYGATWVGFQVTELQMEGIPECAECANPQIRRLFCVSRRVFKAHETAEMLLEIILKEAVSEQKERIKRIATILEGVRDTNGYEWNQKGWKASGNSDIKANYPD